MAARGWIISCRPNKFGRDFTTCLWISAKILMKGRKIFFKSYEKLFLICFLANMLRPLYEASLYCSISIEQCALWYDAAVVHKDFCKCLFVANSILRCQKLIFVISYAIMGCLTHKDFLSKSVKRTVTGVDNVMQEVWYVRP